MPITSVQQGLIAQNEYAKLLMMGSGGLVEVAAPLTDDDRRDYEIHVRGQYGFALAQQIKSTMRLHLSEGGSRYLVCKFDVHPTRIVDHPYFWYFLAYLDPKLMRFADPVFFVPSTFFHAHARSGLSGAEQHFVFEANIEDNSRDLWTPYRVNTLDLGKRVIEVIDDLEKPRGRALTLAPIPSDSDVLWVRRYKKAA